MYADSEHDAFSSQGAMVWRCRQRLETTSPGLISEPRMLLGCVCCTATSLPTSLSTAGFWQSLGWLHTVCTATCDCSLESCGLVLSDGRVCHAWIYNFLLQDQMFFLFFFSLLETVILVHPALWCMTTSTASVLLNHKSCLGLATQMAMQPVCQSQNSRNLSQHQGWF